MGDMKDKFKGFMKKVNNQLSSPSSGKFKGQGRVLGSSSSGPANPIHARYNSPQAPNPNPNPRPKPAPSSSVPSSSDSSSSKPSPEKSLDSNREMSSSTQNPAPDRKPSDGFDPFGSLITSSERSKNGYSLNVFECPICRSSFRSEEEVSKHVERCLTSKNDSGQNDEKEKHKSEVEDRVAAYISGNPSLSSVDVVIRLLRNIAKETENPKFRKVRMSNPKIKEAVVDVAGGIELLEFVGFELKEENEEMWAVMEVPSEEQIQLITETVNILEPRKIEEPKKKESSESATRLEAEKPIEPKKIDRQIRVFFSVAENIAAKIELPDSFYNLTPEEVKREAESRKKKMAESQLLIPKSYKEKQLKAARRRYKRAIIRIQFPDGVVLQGVFAPWEPTTALYEFVSSALKEPCLQFELLDPVLVKRRVIPHFPPTGQKPRTLEEEELVPSALIKFKPIETDSVVFTGLSNELLEIIEPLVS